MFTFQKKKKEKMEDASQLRYYHMHETIRKSKDLLLKSANRAFS